MSRPVRATHPGLRGFQYGQPLPENLLLLPPCGHVTDDGHGAQHHSLAIRRQDDGELDGDPRPVAPAGRNRQPGKFMNAHTLLVGRPARRYRCCRGSGLLIRFRERRGGPLAPIMIYSGILIGFFDGSFGSSMCGSCA